MVGLLLLFSAIFTTGTTYECAANSSQNVEIGCRSYFQCLNGVGTLVDCTTINSQYVYNSALGHCDDSLHVAPPCGQQKDCTGKGDRSYADKDNNCLSYYTCNRDRFFGHNKCSPNLVFDENLQTCNWPQNVDPPCGTHGSARI